MFQLIYGKFVMSNKTIRIKNESAVILGGLKPGKERDIDVCKDGVPLDRYWRNRLRDAAKDNCIKVVTPKKGAK